MRVRQIAPIALVLGLTVAGFIIARALAEHGARRATEHRAEVAAAHISGRVAQAVSLTESLRRFMVDAGGTGVTSAEFARNAFRWLSPADLPAAAWVEQVPASRRAAYEQRIGQPIVSPNPQYGAVPTGSRSSYLPATLVSGFPPMSVAGIDLRGEPGMATALERSTRLDGVAATPLGGDVAGTHGLFLVAPAPNLVNEVLRPGYVVLFVPAETLLAAADTPGVQLAVSWGTPANPHGGKTVSRTFQQAGQRFDVVLPQQSLQGTAEALPWIILAAGLVLAGFAVALELNAGRRAHAQAELDRIFNLSSDVIAVADFEGHFTRVNPAVEQVLGYTQEEFLAKPYLELVHPDDRERTAAEAAAIARGKKTTSFENRYVHKDGSYKLLDWTSTPVVEDRLMYGVARDVTERRQDEKERGRLAEEQAALRRVATLVAQKSSADEVFAQVAQEVGLLLEADTAGVCRYEPDEHATLVAAWGRVSEILPVGRRFSLDDDSVTALVYRTERPARFDAYEDAAGSVGEYAREVDLLSACGTPIVVGGRLWGSLVVASSRREVMVSDAEARMAKFTELVATAISNVQARAEVEELAEEQAALRRVATLVARGGRPDDVFTAVTAEVAGLLPVTSAAMGRFEPDGTVTTVAAWSPGDVAFPVARRWETEGNNVTGIVFSTARPARIDDFSDASGPIGVHARNAGYRSAVGSPIIVEGRLWGLISAASTAAEPLPADTEARLASFTELVAAAIANAQSRRDVRQLADEQAALRRVATLVARESAPEEIFAAVGDEVRGLVGNDLTSMFRCEPGDMLTLVAVRSRGPVPDDLVGARIPMREAFVTFLKSGQPVRLDTDATANWIVDLPQAAGLGLKSAIGVPIVVAGRPWGAIFVCDRRPDGLPPEVERPFTQFTELVGTAIANAQARAQLSELADEQAALRRVAELVAREAPHGEIFAAIAAEIGQLLGTDEMRMMRYEREAEAVVVAAAGARDDVFPIDSRWPLGGESVAARVFRTRQPARVDDYQAASGQIAETVRSMGIRAVVGTPILVHGRLWGAMLTGTFSDEPLLPDTESRLGQFTELMATAIANAEARAEVKELAEEQAALRRVATLVAEGAPAAAVFDAVAAEMKRVLGADGVTLSRYEPNDEAIVLAHSGSDPRRVPPGTRVSHRGDNVTSLVRFSKRSARMEHRDGAVDAIAELARGPGVRASVGAPIVVEGRLWGVAIANWRGEKLPPPDTEERMSRFAELLDTAIANADSRDQLTASRARLLTEADNARRRVVRDLHDGAQQRLVHTIVTLKLARRALRASEANTESLIAEALEHAQQGNEALRELAHGILPAVLTQGGLRAGIETVVSRIDLPVEVDVPDERFPTEVEASAYFIVSEALTNVVKHSHAGRAQVRGSVADGTLRVEIRDDGIGGADPAGHGLMGLADRVTALEGRLDVESPVGGGTVLAATLPLARSTDTDLLNGRPSPRPAAPR